MSGPRTNHTAKAPIRWSGILFALAANLLLTTAGDALASILPLGLNAELLATIVAPLLAGTLTALYVKQRGGIHAFFGGMLSVPIMIFFIFPENWQFAVFSGAFCTLGGALTEIYMRRRSV